MSEAASPGPILVVDDDDTIRETVAEALVLDGFKVATARNGAEALALVRERRPSGIVLDLMMPIMTGWQFLERCRASHLCSGVPVVVMSAYSKLPEEAARLGVKGCIAKPFDLDVLLGAIERAVQRAT
ncbi:MAG: response regulator [Chloroflexi bacterium]|nr:response regulator [Chloroflexota bacterium]MBV9602184.1 response regulator [Chloroflexota bacterium]